MISGEKVRFDQNVPEKNIVTLPNRNERFKLQWQQVQLVPYSRPIPWLTRVGS